MNGFFITSTLFSCFQSIIWTFIGAQKTPLSSSWLCVAGNSSRMIGVTREDDEEECCRLYDTWNKKRERERERERERGKVCERRRNYVYDKFSKYTLFIHAFFTWKCMCTVGAESLNQINWFHHESDSFAKLKINLSLHVCLFEQRSCEELDIILVRIQPTLNCTYQHLNREFVSLCSKPTQCFL